MKPIQWTFLLLLLTFACEKDNINPPKIEFLFDFSADAQGWVGDFADYPSGEESSYELSYQWTSLPAPLDTNQNALMMLGNSRNEDLFMFMKKKVGNLPANKEFTVFFDIELASKYPLNGFSVGSSLGERIRLKAGVTLEEPLKKLNSSGYYEMNIDKGNSHRESGNDMIVIGHLSVAPTTREYTLIKRDNMIQSFSFRTDENGEAWLVIGTDSSVEDQTRLFYNNVKVIFWELPQ